jgi:hypothetical protein
LQSYLTSIGGPIFYSNIAKNHKLQITRFRMFKPILNARQKQFIHSVVSRDDGYNRPVLEAIVKTYILNEGLYPPAAPGIPTRSHKALMESAEKELSPELKKTITFEPDCWERTTEYSAKAARQ